MTLTLISNLGEERYYYPPTKRLEPDEYLIWYFCEMLETHINIEQTGRIKRTLVEDTASEERIRRKIAIENKQKISWHIFATTPYSIPYRND